MLPFLGLLQALMIKGKHRTMKHLNNKKVPLWLPGHDPEGLKVGYMPLSLM